uniref:Uncharacterized protein n=1 Tax=Nicotiana tabacum TaxID=4097 RepID=A0A1S3ZPD9_TOBAC|nr:PREDICTED: uncharacterized protein LOC107788921 [Nicotiana tabacum]
MTLPNLSEGMALASFQNGLSRDGSRASRKLLSRLMKYPPTLWDEIHNDYCAEVREDEDDLNRPTYRLISVQAESRNNLCSREAWNKGKVAVKDEERGHKTEDFISLQQEIVNMLRQGHLRELLSDKGRYNFGRGCEHQGPPKPRSPACTINMIIRGGDDVSINGVNFTTTHKLKRSITLERYNMLEESITFDELDADGLTFPHNDSIVITLRILDTDVKRTMWDDGSGVCIIHPRVLAQMTLEDNIVPRCITLIGFNNAVERISGEITLPVLAGGVTLEMTFHIMDHSTAYNAIVGRLWIHPMRAVPSSLYQVIKFPTPWGIFSIHGEQCTPRECYRIALISTITQRKKDKEKEA